MSVIITGTGRYVPEEIVGDQYFLTREFYNEKHNKIDLPTAEIISKLKCITGISQRRYVTTHQTTSDIGIISAKAALTDSGLDPEKLDGIIFAHNYGDVKYGNAQSDTVPSLASRVKHALGISNANCIAFDILFGCPGWVQGMIMASQFLQSGIAKKYLVIGAETLSRVSDPYDRDSMIYADGAGAAVLEHSGKEATGVLATCSQSYTKEEAYYLDFNQSFNETHDLATRYIKMQGRRIYEFALNRVPQAMKECMEKSGIPISQLKKVFLHQANKKMDDAIIQSFYKLYHLSVPDGIMPMTIQDLGNSSVATVPTLFDMVKCGALEGHEVHRGDVVLFASVGAGMNVNAFVYKI